MRALLLFAALAVAAPAKPAKPPAPTPAVVQTADGLSLEASLTVPAKARRGVLFVHQGGRNRADWDSLAAAFARDGVMTLSFDLRGHGSQAGSPPAELGPADYQAMQGDVAAALAVLARNGAERVAIVGSELGANLAINAAVADPSVVSVVMLSPGVELKGIIAIDAVQRFGARSLALVASADDMAGDRAVAALAAKAQGPHDVMRLENAGRGVKMLMRDPSLEGWIVGWVGAHWELPGRPPPG